MKYQPRNYTRAHQLVNALIARKITVRKSQALSDHERQLILRILENELIQALDFEINLQPTHFEETNHAN